MTGAGLQPRFRIGIDTGGTFTDIVSVDSGSGAMRVTKVASTPANPAVGLVRGVRAILDAGRRVARTTWPVLLTGLPSRPMRCCKGKSARSG